MTNSIDPKSREEPKSIKIEQSSWCFIISDGNSDSNETFPHGYSLTLFPEKIIISSVIELCITTSAVKQVLILIYRMPK